MTWPEKDPPDDVPEAEGDADDHEAEDEAAAAEEATPSRRRSRRRQIEKATKDRLARWDFFQALDPNEPVRSTLRGAGIGNTRGPATAIGDEIARLGRLFYELTRVDAQLTGDLAWGQSVTVEFVSPEADIERSGQAIREAQRATEAVGRQEPDDEELLALRARAVPPLATASVMAVELFRTPSTQAVETALDFGTGVTRAFRALANTVVQDEIELEIEVPHGLERGELTVAHADRIRKVLREEGELQRLTVTAVGVLSIADATQAMFGLRLDPDAARHRALRGKHLVRGHYTDDAETKLRELGLWGKQVRASIEVLADPRGSSSAVRPPTYVLVDVAPRFL